MGDLAFWASVTSTFDDGGGESGEAMMRLFGLLGLRISGGLVENDNGLVLGAFLRLFEMTACSGSAEIAFDFFGGAPS